MKTQLGVYALIKTRADDKRIKVYRDRALFNVFYTAQTTTQNDEYFIIQKTKQDIGYVHLKETKALRFIVNELILLSKDTIIESISAILDYLFAVRKADVVSVQIRDGNKELDNLLRRLGFYNRAVHIRKTRNSDNKTLIKEMIIEKEHFKV
ncbi:MAG: hypothetical protein UMR38_05870 [Candidatus Izemoplasma sp.]|nr:hypothetical protein [Candidatus Izemoplasma sp.]